MKARIAKPLLAWVALFAAAFAAGTLPRVWASNQWLCWHWNKDTIGFQSAASGYWGTITPTKATTGPKAPA